MNRSVDKDKDVYTDAVRNFIDNCIEETAKEAVSEIGQNGGYYFPPLASTHAGIPYYYQNGKNIMPSIGIVENQISLYMKENLFFCTKNFVQFTNYNISQGTITVDTEIQENRVILDVNYPITLSQGEDSATIEDFETEVDVRLGLIYNSIAEVVNSSEYGICLTCLYDVADENDFYVEMLDYDEDSVVILFIDKNSKINEEDFEYVYAVEA